MLDLVSPGLNREERVAQKGGRVWFSNPSSADVFTPRTCYLRALVPGGDALMSQLGKNAS